MLNEGMDALAVTGLDRLSGLSRIRFCSSYAYAGDVSELDPFFVYERTGRKEARVFGFRSSRGVGAASGARARLLSRCRPLDWIELPGWRRSIAGARSLSDLPREARGLVDLLESQQGLGIPVAIISVGPDSASKILARRVSFARR
jgi:adenylosuccinate synthase